MNAPVAATEDLIYSVRTHRQAHVQPAAGAHAPAFAMYEQMRAICEDHQQDRSIKAMILTGPGDKASRPAHDIAIPSLQDCAGCA